MVYIVWFISKDFVVVDFVYCCMGFGLFTWRAARLKPISLLSSFNRDLEMSKQKKKHHCDVTAIPMSQQITISFDWKKIKFTCFL